MKYIFNKYEGFNVVDDDYIVPDKHFVLDEDYYNELMSKQGFNCEIGTDDNGFPILIYDDMDELKKEQRQQYINNITAKRNNLLSSTDWTQLPDVPQMVKEKYAIYRQQLRDITEQSGYPDDIKWPEKPL